MEYDTAVADADRFVTDTEVNALINKAYKELYGLLIRHGMHRSETVYEITADGSEEYALPADLWAVLSVHSVDSSGNAFYMTRHDHRVRPSTSFNADAATYRVVGSDIAFNPIPATGTYEVRYVPVPADLSADGDTLDGVLGWEEYVVCWVARKLLIKEGSLPEAQQCAQDLADLRERIQLEAAASEMSEGTCVQNVRTQPASAPGDWPYSIRPRGGWWGV